MTETDWLSSIDPVPMIRFLMPLHHGRSDRKFRLFVCACWTRYRSDLEHLPAIAEEARVYGHDGANIPNPFSMAESWASVQLASAELEQWDKAELIRCIFGNPFKTHSPFPIPPSVQRMATVIYEERDWAALPILADLLSDAGCQEETILRHCRLASPHVRGCWVLDLILGRS